MNKAYSHFSGAANQPRRPEPRRGGSPVPLTRLPWCRFRVAPGCDTGAHRGTGAHTARGGRVRRRLARDEGRGGQRLRRSDCSDPGLWRRRRGRGFQYLDIEGRESATSRSSSASAGWRFRPRGSRYGSALTHAATCRRPGSTQPGASSTCTTHGGASIVIKPSFGGWSCSRAGCRGCGVRSPPISMARAQPTARARVCGAFA